MPETQDELAALDRAATQEVERLSRELDITNADHVVLWLEAHGYESDGFLAVQIVEAYERAIRRKHIFWGAGEPDCPREIKASNGELHTLRCKVCGEDSPRLDMPCRGALARRIAAEREAVPVEKWQHVAYFDEGRFHWMSGIRPRDCELYAHPPKEPTDAR